MNTIDLDYACQSAVLRVNGEITEASALDLERKLDGLFGYYKYSSVDLEINSPGGSYLGLRHILFVMGRARASGLMIRSKSTFMAASAGAMLLALGEVGSRTVHEYTTLLFHNSRTQNLPMVTASAAQNLSEVMQQIDDSILSTLHKHTLDGFGGTKTLAREGIARCALLVQSHGSNPPLSEHRRPLAPKDIHAMWLRLGNSPSEAGLSAYEQMLRDLFHSDWPLDVRCAYALGLIDRVEGIPELKARADLNLPGSAQSETARVARAGRPAICA